MDGKDTNQIDDLWPHTIPVDTWVIDHISFFRNNWHQKVQVGSQLKRVHTGIDSPDIIHYFKSPSMDGLVFIAEYYSEHVELSLQKDTRQQDKKKLEFANPTFFQTLESFIWNARSLIYLEAYIKSTAQNFEYIRAGLLTDGTTWAQHSNNVINKLLEELGNMDVKVRKVARRFTDEPKQPEVDGKNLVDFDDNVPF